jgi:hypothetical protein
LAVDRDDPGSVRRPPSPTVPADPRADLERLKAERDAADRAYNEALTRLDQAIQPLPADFPHAPPGPDEHQVTPLNTLWRIDAAPAGGAVRRRLIGAVRRIVAPMFAQQQAFNSALVDHINRNVPVDRQTREAIESALAVVRAQLEDAIRFQSLLVMFLQQITPYVDTRDRDVAGLLRGLSGAINAVADELLKRSEAATARDRRLDARLAELETAIAEARIRVDNLMRALPNRRENV